MTNGINLFDEETGDAAAVGDGVPTGTVGLGVLRFVGGLAVGEDTVPEGRGVAAGATGLVEPEGVPTGAKVPSTARWVVPIWHP